MKARIVHRDDVLKIVDLLRQQGYEVVAPFFGRGRDTLFDNVTDENRDQIQLHLPNPYHPPKRFVLPQIERLLRIRQTDGQIEIEPTYREPKRAIFGIRSCDIAGIWHLDRFFLGRDFRDIYYESRRQEPLPRQRRLHRPRARHRRRVLLCLRRHRPGGARPFRPAVDGPGRGEFMVVAGSPAARRCSPTRFSGQAPRRACRNGAQACSDESASVQADHHELVLRHRPLCLAGQGAEKTWEEIGNRCLECGGCTYVCPACTCFTVTDRQVGPDEVERVRIWDACALGGFTRMAGGHNPRRAVHDRRNRRFFRKLAHYFIQRELSWPAWAAAAAPRSAMAMSACPASWK